MTMQAQIQFERNGETVTIERLIDGEVESWEIPIESLPQALILLTYDENGCLWTSIDAWKDEKAA